MQIAYRQEATGTKGSKSKPPFGEKTAQPGTSLQAYPAPEQPYNDVEVNSRKFAGKPSPV